MFPRGLFALLVLSCLCPGLSAQRATPNPFEILARLPQSLSAAKSVATDPASNPFNVVAHRVPGASKGISESMERSFRPMAVLPGGQPVSTTFLFWYLVALVAFLSFAVAAKRNFLIKAWRGFLNDSALTVAQKEATGLTGSTPYFLLYASFLLNAGTFIFLVARFFNPRIFDNPGFLGICLFLGCVLFLFKHVLLSLVGWLYPVSTQVRRYSFLISIFNCVLGLFLVPFNFMIAFISKHQGFLVFWALGLILVFYAYRTLRATSIGLKILSGHFFHFLLYLCIVEIAPVLILLKLAKLAAT